VEQRVVARRAVDVYAWMARLGVRERSSAGVGFPVWWIRGGIYRRRWEGESTSRVLQSNGGAEAAGTGSSR